MRDNIDQTKLIGRIKELERETCRRKSAEKALRERLKSEKLLSELSAILITLPTKDFSEGIQRGLEKICCFMDAQRLTLYQVHPAHRRLKILHQFPTHEIPSDIGQIHQSAAEQFAQAWMPLTRNQTVVWGASGRLKSEVAVAPPPALKKRHPEALSVPTLLKGSLHNVLVVEASARTPQPLTRRKIKTLRFAANLLAIAIERNRIENSLRLANEDLEHRVAWRTVELEAANAQSQKEIEERKCVETDLRLHQRFLETLIDTIPNPIFYKDIHGRYIGCNRVFADQILGLPKADIIGRTLFELSGALPTKLAKFYNDKDLKLLSSRGIQTYFDKVLCADGIKRDFMFYNSTFLDPSGNPAGIVGVMLDVSELRRTEQRLREYHRSLRLLSSEISLAEERERRRIASHLHDHIGQSQAVLKNQLGILKACTRDSEFKPKLVEAYDMVSKIIEDTRTLMFEISPPILYEMGLAPAVEWLIEHMQAQNDLQFQLHHNEPSKLLHNNFSVLLFQSIRELLINAVKHSSAQRVSVSIHYRGQNLVIRIEDDGKGFDPASISTAAVRHKGFGLFSIRERLRHLGGLLTIKSSPGEGTRITLSVPVSCKVVETETEKAILS